MTNPEVCLECDKSLFGKVAEKAVLLSPASVNASILILSMPLPSNTIDMLGLCFRYPMICLNIDSCPFIGSLAARDVLSWRYIFNIVLEYLCAFSRLISIPLKLVHSSLMFS